MATRNINHNFLSTPREPVGTRQHRSPATFPQLTRRSFFKHAVTPTIAAALTALNPPAAHAEVDSKKGVGRVTTKLVEFSPFNADAFTRDTQAQQVMGVLAEYITFHRQLDGTVGDEIVARESSIRLRALNEWGRIEGNPLRVPASIELLPVNTPFNEEIWNRAFYGELVAYLARRGLILIPEFPVMNEQTFGIADYPKYAHTQEMYGLLRISRVVPGTLRMWSKEMNAQRIYVEQEGGFAFRNVSLTPQAIAGERGSVARAMYGNVVIFEKAMLAENQQMLSDYERARPLREQLRGVEWEAHVQTGSKYAADPLEFSRLKLMAAELENQTKAADFRKWSESESEAHENMHNSDQHEDFLQRNPPTTNWKDYDAYMTRFEINYELRGYLSAQRYVLDKYRLPQLRKMMEFMLFQRFLSDTPNTHVKIYFAFFDLILEQLDTDADRYPALKLIEHPKYSRRHQIAGQLYRLTPEQMAEVTERAFVRHEKEFRSNTDHPVPTTVAQLYAGRPHRRSFWEKNKKEILIGGGFAGLVIGLLSWRGVRMWKVRREALEKALHSLRIILCKFPNLKNSQNQTVEEIAKELLFAYPKSKIQLIEWLKESKISLPDSDVNRLHKELTRAQPWKELETKK